MSTTETSTITTQHAIGALENMQRVWYAFEHCKAILGKVAGAESVMREAEARAKDANADLHLTLAAIKRKKEEHDAYAAQIAQERTELQQALEADQAQAQATREALAQEIRTLEKKKMLLQDAITSLKSTTAKL